MQFVSMHLFQPYTSRLNLLIAVLFFLFSACTSQETSSHSSLSKSETVDHVSFLEGMSAKIKKTCADYIKNEALEFNICLDLNDEPGLSKLSLLFRLICQDKEYLHRNFSDLKKVGDFFEGKHKKGGLLYPTGVSFRLGIAHQLMFDNEGWCYSCARHLRGKSASDLLSHIHEYLDYLSEHKDDFGFYSHDTSKDVSKMTRIMRKAKDTILIFVEWASTL